jgi:hypothetical protein
MHYGNAGWKPALRCGRRWDRCLGTPGGSMHYGNAGWKPALRETLLRMAKRIYAHESQMAAFPKRKTGLILSPEPDGYGRRRGVWTGPVIRR